MACNYAVRKRGKIRGIVGLFPIRWKVGDATFEVGGIGGVSTHPKSRGAGYMKALMNRCLEVMREEGYHLSYLGGQRQRYQYFGYERCGLVSSFSLTRSNLRHSFADDPGMRFESLRQEDGERLTRARELHDAQHAHCLRAPDDFYSHLRNWNNQPHAALDSSGRMTGYLVASDKGDSVSELAAENDGVALRMLRAWVAAQSGREVSIGLPAWRADLARMLGAYCESASARPTGNWQIFDWAGVVEALLHARRLGGTLLEGAVVIAIGGYGALELRVEGERTTCVRTAAPADLQCDAYTAMRLLFGPLPASRVLALPASAAVLEQWCPLPLSWPHQDGV
jgi:predicted acetyltransferase